MAQERLQKIIARAGLSSRRGSEELITSGRVRLNGRVVTELGTQADPRNDVIEVDGRRIIAERPVYILLHKPRGVVSTRNDPEGRPTVVELVAGLKATLYPVGRLDFHTSGALLLTNDGDFTQGLLHPKKKVPKIYAVKVQGEMVEADLERWRTGVKLEDGTTAPCEVHFLRHEGGKTWMEVTLHEGRNQQIRRMGEATGFPVMRLARLSFAGITTEGLRPGNFRPLTADELRAIKGDYGVPKRIPKGEPEVEDRPRSVQRKGGFQRSKPSPHAPEEAPRRKDGRAGDHPKDGHSGPPPKGGRSGGFSKDGRSGTSSKGGRSGGFSKDGRSGTSSKEGRFGAPSTEGRSEGRRQKSSAAVPSARAHADKGTRSKPPSRSKRPR